MAERELEARLIVMDTGPLITLAAADSLNYLLYPDVPVYIPDAVLYEATIKSGSLGSEAIASWVQASLDRIHLVLTKAFVGFELAREQDPAFRQRDLGEQAALETIRYAIKLGPAERAVLITEDDRVIRGSVIVLPEDRERLITITTRDFLLGLEAAGRINSADEVYRLAEDAGRQASRLEAIHRQHERAKQAIERLLRRP